MIQFWLKYRKLSSICWLKDQNCQLNDQNCQKSIENDEIYQTWWQKCWNHVLLDRFSV